MNEEEHELRDEVDQSSFQLMFGISILSNFYVGCDFGYGKIGHLNLTFWV